jgi:hypothetical protein
LPDSNPLAAAAETSDHLRQRLMDYGLNPPGATRDLAYQGKRLGWAKVIKAIEMDEGVDQQEIRETIDWALEQPQFEVNGNLWTWGESLCCGEPARKLAAKFATLKGQRARRKRKKRVRLRVERYSPGPHAGSTSYYYADDREIDRDEYVKIQKEQGELD